MKFEDTKDADYHDEEATEYMEADPSDDGDYEEVEDKEEFDDPHDDDYEEVDIKEEPEDEPAFNVTEEDENPYAHWTKEQLEDGIAERKEILEKLEDEVQAKREASRLKKIEKLEAKIAGVKAKLLALGVAPENMLDDQSSTKTEKSEVNEAKKPTKKRKRGMPVEEEEEPEEDL